jgi:hypothetical protein
MKPVNQLHSNERQVERPGKWRMTDKRPGKGKPSGDEQTRAHLERTAACHHARRSEQKRREEEEEKEQRPSRLKAISHQQLLKTKAAHHDHLHHGQKRSSINHTVAASEIDWVTEAKAIERIMSCLNFRTITTASNSI